MLHIPSLLELLFEIHSELNTKELCTIYTSVKLEPCVVLYVLVWPAFLGSSDRGAETFMSTVCVFKIANRGTDLPAGV